MRNQSLIKIAADYVITHRGERQSYCLYSNRPVELTIIYNQWAQQAGELLADIDTAPSQVIRELETSKQGHDLFDRVRDGRVIVYGLKGRKGESS